MMYMIKEESYDGKLYSFNVENVYRSHEDEPAIIKKEGFYEYLIRG